MTSEFNEQLTAYRVIIERVQEGTSLHTALLQRLSLSLTRFLRFEQLSESKIATEGLIGILIGTDKEVVHCVRIWS